MAGPEVDAPRFTVYPRPPDQPLLVAAGATADVTFSGQLSGPVVDGLPYAQMMFVRMAAHGGGVEPTFEMVAGSGDPVLVTADATPISRSPDGVGFIGDVWLDGSEPNGVYRIHVGFEAPTIEQWRLRVTNNDTIEYRFTGVVASHPDDTLQPWIDVSPPQLDFETRVGEIQQKSVAVTNFGTTAVTVTGFDPPLPSALTVTSALPVGLAPGASSTLDVTFTAPRVPPGPDGQTTGSATLVTAPADPTPGHNTNLAYRATTRWPAPVLGTPGAQFSPRLGSSGTPVMLAGSGFDTPGLKVRFGTVDAQPPDAVTATSIRVKVPAGVLAADPTSRHVAITVSTAGGSATSVDTFKVRATDIALVRQEAGWGSIPIAFAQGDGSWEITNGVTPTFIGSWANTSGVRVVTGDFNGNGLTDIALVRQEAGWGSIPIAFAQGDGSWEITNGVTPTFIGSWANTSGVRVVTGDFNGNGLTDIALVRQEAGWGSIPIAFAQGDGSWEITNGVTPTFIGSWANTSGVRVVTGDFNGNGLTDIALVRQEAGWGSIPIAFAQGDGSWEITNGVTPTFIGSWANTSGVRVVTGDFNGNGLTDIALVRQEAGWGSIPIAFAQGDGSWEITNGVTPTFIGSWANTSGVRVVTGDFNGNGLTDIALVRQEAGWGSIPIAFAQGDGSWEITNGVTPTFIGSWANTSGVRVVTGDFNGNGLTDIALVRQEAGWGSIPIAFAQGDGSWEITNGVTPTFIGSWANTSGVQVVTGDYR